MNHITIAADDRVTAKDFTKGSPVQVRVEITGDESQYKKGRMIRVTYESQETEAVIVSDPIVVSTDLERKTTTLSLIIERDMSFKES